MKNLVFIGILISLSISAHGQVREIKNASAGSVKGSAEGRPGGGTSFFFIELAEISIHGLVEWQKYKLQKRDVHPAIVSWEVSLQSAVQPSSYYIVHPRLRGNWGLFSTDLRLNYLIEESLDGIRHIRTTDWQILQLNVITTPAVNFRVGGGLLHEAFNDRKGFDEWTAALSLAPVNKRLSGTVEYRYSMPRKECSAALHYLLFISGRAHLYATGGALYQNYYATVSVWGVQGGVMMRFF